MWLYCTAPSSLQDCAWADWRPGRFATAAHWFTRILSFKSSQQHAHLLGLLYVLQQFHMPHWKIRWNQWKEDANSFLWREWWQTDPSGGLLTHGPWHRMPGFGPNWFWDSIVNIQMALSKQGGVLWRLQQIFIKKKRKIPSAGATSIHDTGWA